MPKQVTMGWNEKENKTVEQRSKEEANDYRYFPEPDLPILHFTEEYLSELRTHIPELPGAKRLRFKEEFALEDGVIESLIAWKELNYFFEAVVSEIDAWIESENRGDRQKMIKQAANWCLQDFSALLNAKNQNPLESTVLAENLAELITMIEAGQISGSAAKQVFKVMFDKGGEPDSIVTDLGLAQVSDTAEIEKAVDEVIAKNEKAIADYKAGQEKSFGFLVGQVMAHMKGKANPQVVNELLLKKLS
jgi:aspartyl-tRNA(Asn)/glutamyl-tRNA(Gln) amidotransferase subunit B